MAGIIKVNQYQDFNGNTIFTSDGSGNLTTQEILYPSFKATASSATTIATGTYTTITLDGAETWDTDSAFASNTFTVPTGKAGKYMFSYGVTIANLGDADFSEIILTVNGTKDEKTRYRSLTGVAQTTIMRASAMLDLSAGDTVVLQGYHNYGSNRDTSASQTSFEGFKIGS
jgi:hypothetical protein